MSLRGRRATDDESIVAVNGSQSDVVSGLNVEELADDEDRSEPKSTMVVAFLQLFLITFS